MTTLPPGVANVGVVACNNVVWYLPYHLCWRSNVCNQWRKQWPGDNVAINDHVFSMSRHSAAWRRSGIIKLTTLWRSSQ